MKKKVAINGFGRIGRLTLRALYQKYADSIEIVAINDLMLPEQLAYLLRYDSVHKSPPFSINHSSDSLIIEGKKIPVFAEKKISSLPWKEKGVDFVIESTGKWTTKDQLIEHTKAGAKKVILTAPSLDIPTLVMGVNHTQYNPSSDHIVSNASCTTNCLAVLAKVLLQEFGIEEGLMTTVHSLTASQLTVDGSGGKDWRAGRAAGLNIIPASTGAAKAVTLCLPELKGKLTGMAFRVPTPDVSVVDLTVRLSKSTSYKEICQAMEKASQTSLQGILGYEKNLLVSSDFIGTSYSCIFDESAGIELNSKFYKLIAWYDNEMGYSYRVGDLVRFMASC